MLPHKSTIAEYDEFVAHNELVESFLPCQRSSLNAKYFFSFVSDPGCILNSEHAPLYHCKNMHEAYFTCITYCSTVECRQRHVCNIFPILIGSKLDHAVFQKLYPERYRRDLSCFDNLFGMIFVDGTLCYFPNIFTNRKQMGHMVKRSNDIFCIYLYDSQESGHRLTVVQSGEMVYRSNLGKNYTLAPGTFDIPIEFPVDGAHLDMSQIYDVVSKIYRHTVPIDSMENKLIFSMMHILMEVCQMARHDWKLIRRYMLRGELEKFLSTRIEFASVNDTKKNSSANGLCGISGFHYRKIAPNQIPTTREAAVARYDRYVVRPTGRSVLKSSVPERTEFFLCPIERSMNINQPNRWLTLLDTVEISTKATLARGDSINDVIEFMCNSGLIVAYERGANVKKHVLINGCVCTKYQLAVDRIDTTTLRALKQLNSHYEYYETSDFLMINIYPGIPFIRVGDCAISPLELHNTLRADDIPVTLRVFGPNISEQTVADAQYAVISKLLIATNHMKNRYSTSKTLKYFGYTNENTNVAIKNLNPNDLLMSVDLRFSSHPQIIGDSYIINRDLKVPCVIMHKTRFEFDFDRSTNIVFENNLTAANCMVTRNSMDMPIRKELKVMRIEKFGAPLSIKIFPQIKMYAVESENAAGRIYNIYKYFDEMHHLESENFDICVTGIVRATIGKTLRMYVDVVTSIECSNYDGMKFCDDCSQKGIVLPQDCSRYDSKTEVVASIFSIPARQPVGQMKRLRRNNPTSEILRGQYQMGALKNNASSFKNIAPTKFDNYQVHILSTNNVNHGVYDYYQATLPREERGRILPMENSNALGTINAVRVNVAVRHGGKETKLDNLMDHDEYRQVADRINNR